MASSNEIGKKEEEVNALLPFLDAYAEVTDEELSIVEEGENPDFICVRSDGTRIGVELVRITRNLPDIHWDRVLDEKHELEPFECQELILSLISRKEKARTERYVNRVPECVLLLQLTDGSIRNIRYALDGSQDDFKDHGFSEIWIADYSDLDAYGNVELYGLFPACFWGFHERPNADSKPYG